MEQSRDGTPTTPHRDGPNDYLMAIECVLEKVVARAISKSKLNITPFQLDVSCKRLLYKIWKEVEGHVFDISPQRLEILDAKIFKELSFIGGGNDVLMVLAFTNPVYTPLVVRTFVEIILNIEYKSTLGTFVSSVLKLFKCRKPCLDYWRFSEEDFLIDRGDAGDALWNRKDKLMQEMEQFAIEDIMTFEVEDEDEAADKKEVDMTKSSVSSVLNQLIFLAHDQSQIRVKKQKLTKISERFLPLIWAEIEGEEVDTCDERLKKLPRIMLNKLASKTKDKDVLRMMLSQKEETELLIVCNFLKVLKETPRDRKFSFLTRKKKNTKQEENAKTTTGKKKRDPEQNLYKKAVGWILKGVINRVAAASDMSSCSKRLRDTYERLLHPIWGGITGRFLDISQERVEDLPEKIIAALSERNPEKDLATLMFLPKMESETLLVSTFLEILLEPKTHESPSFFRRILRIFGFKTDDSYTRASRSDMREDEKNNYIYIRSTEMILRKLINEAVLKSDVGLPPKLLDKIYERLFPKVWVQIRGIKFNVCPFSLKRVHKRISKHFCMKFGAVSKDLLILFNSSLPRVDTFLIDSFKKFLKPGSDTSFLLNKFMCECGLCGEKKDKLPFKRTDTTEQKLRAINKLLAKQAKEGKHAKFVEHATGRKIRPEEIEPLPEVNQETLKSAYKIIVRVIRVMIYLGSYKTTPERLHPKIKEIVWTIWANIGHYQFQIPKLKCYQIGNDVYYNFIMTNKLVKGKALPCIDVDPVWRARLVCAFRMAMFENFKKTEPYPKILFDMTFVNKLYRDILAAQLREEKSQTSKFPSLQKFFGFRG